MAEIQDKRQHVDDTVIYSKQSLELAAYECMKTEIVAAQLATKFGENLQPVHYALMNERAKGVRPLSRNLVEISDEISTPLDAYRQITLSYPEQEMEKRRTFEYGKTSISEIHYIILHQYAVSAFIFQGYLSPGADVRAIIDELFIDIEEQTLQQDLRLLAIRDHQFRRFERENYVHSNMMLVTVVDFYAFLGNTVYIGEGDVGDTYSPQVLKERLHVYYKLSGLLDPGGNIKRTQHRFQCAFMLDVANQRITDQMAVKMLNAHARKLDATCKPYVDAAVRIIKEINKRIRNVDPGIAEFAVANEMTHLDASFAMVLALLDHGKINFKGFTARATELENEANDIDASGSAGDENRKFYLELLLLWKTGVSLWPICDALKAKIVAYPDFKRIAKMFVWYMITQHEAVHGYKHTPASPFVRGQEGAQQQRPPASQNQSLVVAAMGRATGTAIVPDRSLVVDAMEKAIANRPVQPSPAAEMEVPQVGAQEGDDSSSEGGDNDESGEEDTDDPLMLAMLSSPELTLDVIRHVREAWRSAFKHGKERAEMKGAARIVLEWLARESRINVANKQVATLLTTEFSRMREQLVTKFGEDAEPQDENDAPQGDDDAPQGEAGMKGGGLPPSLANTKQDNAAKKTLWSWESAMNGIARLVGRESESAQQFGVDTAGDVPGQADLFWEKMGIKTKKLQESVGTFVSNQKPLKMPYEWGGCAIYSQFSRSIKEKP